MSRPALRTLRTLAAAGLVAGAAAGCGKLGALDRPGPLFHRGGTAGTGGTTAAATSARATDQARKSQDPTHPINTVDPRDVNTEPAPPRTLPIPGAPSDPGRSQPPGALPDPYANPR